MSPSFCDAAGGQNFCPLLNLKYYLISLLDSSEILFLFLLHLQSYWGSSRLLKYIYDQKVFHGRMISPSSPALWFI